MLLAIPIVVLLALLVAMGTASTARAASGGFINWLAKVATATAFLGFVPVDAVLHLSQRIDHALGKYFQAIESRGTRWFSALAHYTDVMGYWSVYWPVGLYHAVTHLVGSVIPHAINARTKPLSQRIDSVEAQAKANAGVAHSTTKIVKANSKTVEVTRIERVAMPHAAEWDWVHEHFGTLKKAVAAAAAGAIGIALPHAPSFPIPWRGQIKSLKKRLTKVEAIAGITGLAAVLAGLLGVSKGCLGGNGNIGKAARRICGLDSSLLDSLLLGTALLAGPISIVEFATAMRLVEDEFNTVLKAGISELQGL